MAERGLTPGEQRWPSDNLWASAASAANDAAIEILLSTVWTAYDAFRADGWSSVDLTLTPNEVERSLTQAFWPYIRLSDYSPFRVVPSFVEFESRQAPPARSPEYDIAFQLIAQPRIAWPMEAKVLQTDGTLAEYVKAINQRFLTGKYAPFTSSAAMLGYLITGTTDKCFGHLSTKLGVTLNAENTFIHRAHRTSSHERVWPLGDARPVGFTCHHLLMDLSLRN
jgi:hypothetical protein